MIADIADAFGRCASERDVWRVRLEAQRSLTPPEFAELLAIRDRLPPSAQPWLDEISALGRFAERDVAGFARRTLGPNADLYGDPALPKERKRLIIGFAGISQQLMLPAPCVLQFLAPRKCDVVLLRDPDRQQFHRGVRDYAPTFLDVLARVRTDVPFAGYRRVFTFGTSMGAVSALRAGLLLGAHRAVAVGARMPWHVPRLQAGGDTVLPAFDPICACWQGTRTTLLVAYGSANRKDREEAERIAARLPVRLLPLRRIRTHNPLIELARRDRLGAFFDRVFEMRRKGPRSRSAPRGARR